MQRKNMVILAAALLGLILGVTASSTLKPQQTECEKTEQNIRQQADVPGAVACFKPGVIDVNVSDRVEEGAELQCVCRQSFEGQLRIFAINRAS